MSYPCRLCGSEKTNVLFQRADTYFWHGPLTPYFAKTLAKANMPAKMYACDNCGFIGLPVDETLRSLLYDYYTSPLSMPGTTHGDTNAFSQARTDEFFSVLSEMGVTEVPQKVFEAGCQQGFLLAEFLKRGSQKVVGVEPGDVSPIKDLNGRPIDVRRGFLSKELVGEGQFDFAYSLQVFEHIEQPNEFLGILRDLLRVGGKLLLAVPNEGLALKAGNPGAFVFQHLNLFTDFTLSETLRRNGFKPLGCIIDQEKPLYVLAEKTQTQETGISIEKIKESTNLLNQYNDKVEAKIRHIEAITHGKPEDRIALWGCNAALANIFSWGKGFRTKKWRILDSDPNKIGLKFGGIPNQVEGPEALNDVSDVIVVPYRAEPSIMRTIANFPAIQAKIHRLYENHKVEP